MKIVFLCQRVPFPPNKGERTRAFHQIRWLAQEHAVHVLALAESAAEAAGAEELGRLCESVEVFRRGPRTSKVRAAIAAATGAPLTPAFFLSFELARRVRWIARRSPPDAVVACSSSMAQYARMFRGVPKLLDLVDVDSAKWAGFAEQASLPWRLVYRLEARRLRAYEREQAAAFERIALTTECELEKLRELAPAANAFVLRMGIDASAFGAVARDEAPVPTLLFTGQMDYLPNVAAVTHFGRQVFPRLRRRRPTLEFKIVGRNPSPAVDALTTVAGIDVTGEVPDIAPYLARAWVFVAPLRETVGVPSKILEAMAACVPTVATAAAVRGLAGEVQDGRDLLVADDDEGLAGALERLLSQRHLRERIGASGRRFVCRSYAWQESGRRLEEALREIAAEPRRLELVAPAREAEIA